jgi:hypothetical protein
MPPSSSSKVRLSAEVDVVSHRFVVARRLFRWNSVKNGRRVGGAIETLDYALSEAPSAG